VVQGIVGLKRWRCVATGFANHAGTTPMNRRKDALAAASRDSLAVREVVRGEAGPQVGTVGYMKAEPGAVNVIPGRVEFPIELRDLDAVNIDGMWERIQSKMKEIDKDENVETHCSPLDDIVPARTDAVMQSPVHDAQQMAKLAPIGMIFVPSHDGIRHSPKEFTSWHDVANGTEVLYRTVLLVDRQLDAGR
jgi:N-carbamoyl-L-amino-acid hydrolase